MHRSLFGLAYRLAPLTFTALAALTGCGSSADSFTLTSPAFVDGGTLPVDYTCDGSRASPPVAWANAPAGTQSFAVTMHHIPGPGDRHVYLVLYDIPASTSALPANVSGVGTFGINTVDSTNTYTPPCSHCPGEKLYTLTAYALSAEPQLTVPPLQVTMDALLAAMADRTLATATLNVTYDRPGAPCL